VPDIATRSFALPPLMLVASFLPYTLRSFRCTPWTFATAFLFCYVLDVARLHAYRERHVTFCIYVAFTGHVLRFTLHTFTATRCTRTTGPGLDTTFRPGRHRFTFTSCWLRRSSHFRSLLRVSFSPLFACLLRIEGCTPRSLFFSGKIPLTTTSRFTPPLCHLCLRTVPSLHTTVLGRLHTLLVVTMDCLLRYPHVLARCTYLR